MSDVVVVYSTFAKEDEAVSVAQTLLAERLIACANISPTRSIYRWEGKLQDERETALSVKTSAEKQGAVIARIQSLHNYELPCVVAYKVADGYPAFMEWVQEETDD